MPETCKLKDKDRGKQKAKQKEREKITNLGMANRFIATQIRTASIVMAMDTGSQNAPRNETPRKLRHAQPLLEDKRTMPPGSRSSTK